jgi:hypothetical protein
MASYNGVYSTTESLTKNSTLQKSTVEGERLAISTPDALNTSTIFTQGELEAANLNVAKIRLVSTIPEKSVDSEVANKAYVGFILTNVQEAHSEKLQIIPLPGDTYASYFYGAQPRQFSFSGVLLNTKEDKWRDSFEQLYENYIRGSTASRNFNIVQVSYGNRVVSGWLSMLSQQVEGNSDLYTAFSFTMLVSRVDIIGEEKDLYLKYMTKSIGILEQSLIEQDFAVLSSENYDNMVEPVRTGFTKAPPRPKRGGGRSNTSSKCSFTKAVTQAGDFTLTAGSLINNDVFSGSNCSYANTFRRELEKIKEVEKELETIKSKGTLNGKKVTALQASKKVDEYRARVKKYKQAKTNLSGELTKEVKEATILKSANADLKAGAIFSVKTKQGVPAVSVKVTEVTSEGVVPNEAIEVTIATAEANDDLIEAAGLEAARNDKAKKDKIVAREEKTRKAATANALN